MVYVMNLSAAPGQENCPPVGNEFGFRVSAAPEADRDMAGTKVQIIVSMQADCIAGWPLECHQRFWTRRDISTGLFPYSCHLYDFNPTINLCACCSGSRDQAQISNRSKSAAKSDFFDQNVIDSSFLRYYLGRTPDRIAFPVHFGEVVRACRSHNVQQALETSARDLSAEVASDGRFDTSLLTWPRSLPSVEQNIRSWVTKPQLCRDLEPSIFFWVNCLITLAEER
jgi:hypothetical protein